MRLIDSEKLFAELQKEADDSYKNGNCGISNGIKIAMTFVRDAETVQVTPKPEYCWNCGEKIDEVIDHETY